MKSLIRFFQNNATAEFFVLWILSFLASILVRLPLFLSDSFWFDGDEAIIGIMAQDLLSGTHFPIYFYGQNYGFSTFEVISTAIFEFFFGPSVWSLKLGGLLIFSLGVVFIIKGVRERISNKWTVLVITLLVIAYPTWYKWGGMVRGGYVTAFLLCCTLFYLISKGKYNLKTTVLISIICAFIFESQSLILLGFSPLLFHWYRQMNKKLKPTVVITSVFLATILLIRIIGYSATVVWEKPEMHFDFYLQIHTLFEHFKSIINSFTGYYYYSRIIEIPILWWILSLLFLLLCGYYICRNTVRNPKKYFFFTISIVGVIIIQLFFISSIKLISPRYLIGIFTGLLFWLLFIVSEEVATYKKSPIIILLISIISLVGIFWGSNQNRGKHYSHINESKSFNELYKEVKSKGATTVFLKDGLLQWQWNYLYGRNIPGRSFYKKERIPYFTELFYNTFLIDPNNTFIVGELSAYNNKNNLYPKPALSTITTGQIYFAYKNNLGPNLIWRMNLPDEMLYDYLQRKGNYTKSIEIVTQKENNTKSEIVKGKEALPLTAATPFLLTKTIDVDSIKTSNYTWLKVTGEFYIGKDFNEINSCLVLTLAKDKKNLQYRAYNLSETPGLKANEWNTITRLYCIPKTINNSFLSTYFWHISGTPLKVHSINIAVFDVN